MVSFGEDGRFDIVGLKGEREMQTERRQIPKVVRGQEYEHI